MGQISKLASTVGSIIQQVAVYLFFLTEQTKSFHHPMPHVKYQIFLKIARNTHNLNKDLTHP